MHRVQTCITFTIDNRAEGGAGASHIIKSSLTISLVLWLELDPGWTLLCTIDSFEFKFKVTIYLHLTSARLTPENGIQWSLRCILTLDWDLCWGSLPIRQFAEIRLKRETRTIAQVLQPVHVCIGFYDVESDASLLFIFTRQSRPTCSTVAGCPIENVIVRTSKAYIFAVRLYATNAPSLSRRVAPWESCANDGRQTVDGGIHVRLRTNIQIIIAIHIAGVQCPFHYYLFDTFHSIARRVFSLQFFFWSTQYLYESSVCYSIWTTLYLISITYLTPYLLGVSALLWRCCCCRCCRHSMRVCIWTR